MRAVFLTVFACACSASPLTGGALEAAFESIVTERASIELACPADQITVVDMGGEAFRASGCGLFADYECEYSWSDSYNDNGAFLYVCKRAAQDEGTPLPDGG